MIRLQTNPNESEPEFNDEEITTRRVQDVLPMDRRFLSGKIFTLARDPIFSGSATPGTQILGRIYDRAGHIAGQARTFADAGGNWLMQIHEVDSCEYYRVEFEQITGTGLSDIYGELALYPGANTYQTMEMQPWTQYDKPLSVEDAILDSPYNSLLKAHSQYNRPLGFKRKGA